MPTEDYDEIDDDDFDEVDELDDDEVDEVDVEEDANQESDGDTVIEKGRRQLRRGRLSEFSDKLSGGAARPGEKDVRKSPFVMIMAGGIIALTLLGLVFFIMILSKAEENAFAEAEAKFKENSYPEAKGRLVGFLQAYPDGGYAEQARILYHKTMVLEIISGTSFTSESISEALKQLNDFIRVCQDLEGFKDEHDDVRRFADRIVRIGASRATGDPSRKVKPDMQPLEDSKAAKTIMEKFAGPDGLPRSTDDEIRLIQRRAEAAIRKASVLDGALDEINGHLKADDTLAALESRQALIDEYEVLSDDADVAKILTRIMEQEKTLTKQEDLNKDAVTEDFPSSDRVSASLTLRTQVTVDQVSQGKLVFAVGVGSCYGIDSETGEPVWKRAVGRDAPFAPIPVDASEPSLLTYHTDTNELLLLSQKNGDLLWRLRIPSLPSGSPVIFQQQIYLTTESGELWKISVGAGKAISRVIFNQPVVGPPAVTRDEKHMVIAGDQSLVYTLTISPLECVAVSYVEHRLGSVEAPILTAGKMMLMADNDSVEKARLRVLQVDPGSGGITVLGSETVDGQVRDASLLIRGRELYVPSTPQRVTAFRVNDEPDADHLARVGANQLEDAATAPIFLRAGPAGQLWMASEALRKFQVRTNTLELQSDAVAEGLHLQPIQMSDQNFFVTTNEPYSSSIFFTRVEPQEMTDQWRTVIGTNVVSAGPAENNQSLLAIGDFGRVFRVPLEKIKTGGFVIDDLSEYRVPDGLEDAIGGLSLSDGRLAAYCGGEEPGMWTFTNNGQLERIWLLPGAPDVPPVSLADGVVFAVPGRLHFTANRAGTVQDYRAAQGQGENQQASWKSLVALNDTQVLAVNSDNELIRVEYRTSPRRHLFEVSRTRMEQPIELAPAAAGDLLAVVTSDGKLMRMSAVTLEVLDEHELGGVAMRSPYISGDRIFVEVARRELKVFARDGSLQESATVPLNGTFLTGQPVARNEGGYVACLSNGKVIVLDAEGNDTGKSLMLGQEAQMGPIVVGNSLVVIGVDGSLYSVEDVLD
ncbi:MAG: PQQ-binding-like beta-propeller repeat protein [Fuerstiella sp.]|nr:PQQ-binding-like beta-propeller repeat protein [Fuerstiella sp.]MCP4857266.1 PQQ-binding-like beta-propeller repeat protein [Fuerstiella sp.]